MEDDLKKLLDEQTEKVLLEGGGGWLLAARIMGGMLEDLGVRLVALEEHVAINTFERTPASEETITTVAEGDGAASAAASPEKPTTEPLDHEQEAKNILKSGRGKQLRRGTQLSATKAGKLLGVSEQCVRGWESARYFPKGDNATHYLEFVTAIAAGNIPEVEAEPPKPNGNRCLFCQQELTGLKTRYCNNSHRSAYEYIQSLNPSATNSEIRYIIDASLGERKPGQKRRKYKRVDEIRSEMARKRAAESKVPDQV